MTEEHKIINDNGLIYTVYKDRIEVDCKEFDRYFMTDEMFEEKYHEKRLTLDKLF